MKRNFIVLFIFLLIFTALSGCSNETQAEEKTVLRFAYADNSQPVKDAMDEFGRLLEEKTGGKVIVKYFPDSQLGGERESIELAQTGAIDITKVSASALESFSSQYSIFGIPYLFDNEKHFYNVMESNKIMDPIYKSTEDLGIVGLTYYDSGQRSFYLTDGPVETPEDLKGKKIRVMDSETAIKMVKLLGGAPTPMGSDEVYTSLQQGIIDGAENNEFVLATAGHGGVTKYYSYDEHTRVPDILVINKERLNNLTKQQEEAIYEAAEESTKFERKAWKEEVENEKKTAVDEHGVEFNSVDSEPFEKAVQPIHEEFKNKAEFKEVYEDIQDLREE